MSERDLSLRKGSGQNFSGQLYGGIEFGIVSAYRKDPQILDFDVEQAVNALIKVYTTEMQQRSVTPPKLIGRAQKVYDLAKEMCELRLGRSSSQMSNWNLPNSGPPTISLEVMIACLKRIRKSVQTWTKRGGRQGYLHFVEEFVR